ncbi:MAG: hypothetical protein Q8R07_04055 [Candidatus Uhrbacteria bacterium]|nr:hypothetical protein [Candidatus Uhrbacteria bacterium]
MTKALGDQFVIFTTTLYREDAVSAVRSVLAKRFLENAGKLGIRCVVVDGGSNPDFLIFLKSLPHVTLLEDPTLGMGEGRRAALNKALEFPVPYFLWSEPEKDGLITQENLSRLLREFQDKKVDVIVPKRESMESLPKFQRQMESRANQRAARLLNTDKILDLWFGPKAMNREGAKYFTDYKGKLDKWDAIIKPVLDAYRDGKRVASVPIDYTYDPSQSRSEEHDRAMKLKRLEQYTQILAELGDTFSHEKLMDRGVPQLR